MELQKTIEGDEQRGDAVERDGETDVPPKWSRPLIRVTVSRGRVTRKRATYNIDLDGARVVENKADCEFDACRVLLARGITGTLVTRWNGQPCNSMLIDIRKGALRTVIDSDRTGPRFAKWNPRPDGIDFGSGAESDGASPE